MQLLRSPAFVVGGKRRPVTRRREQAVLARLALPAPQPVALDVLVADVWGEPAPPTAVDAVRVHVSNLRKLLAGADRPAGEVLAASGGHYRLDLPPSAVDVSRLDLACRHQDVDELRALLPAFDESGLDRFESGTGFFESIARRLTELRLAGVEMVALADLDEDRPQAAVADIERALADAPYHERLWELLVRALAQADRRTEASRAFQRARLALDEVGMEPGPGLAAAEASIFEAVGANSDRRLRAEYIDVDGSRIAFATLGAGPVDLLFLHGGFVPFDVMQDAPRLAHFIDGLAARFRVIFVDRRGTGMSDPPADGAPVRYEHWVADCVAVLDALHAEQVAVFAQEHAGPLAIELAAQFPGRVRWLALHSTAARPLRAPDHPFGPSSEIVDRIDRIIDRLPGADDVAAIVAPSATHDPRFRAWLERAGRLGASPAVAKHLHRMYLEADVRHRLPHVRIPAVILHPARYVRTDPGQARYLAEHLPDAELHLLDSADHIFWTSDADEVMAAIDRLVARSSPRSGGESTRLRALVAVAPEAGVDVLSSHGAEACLLVSGAVVAPFASLAAARTAAEALERLHPEASIVIDVADTTGAPDDDAVAAVASAARARVETGSTSAP